MWDVVILWKNRFSDGEASLYPTPEMRSLEGVRQSVFIWSILAGLIHLPRSRLLYTLSSMIVLSMFFQHIICPKYFRTRSDKIVPSRILISSLLRIEIFVHRVIQRILSILLQHLISNALMRSWSFWPIPCFRSMQKNRKNEGLYKSHLLLLDICISFHIVSWDMAPWSGSVSPCCCRSHLIISHPNTPIWESFRIPLPEECPAD